MNRPTPTPHNRLLIVEGPDDKHVVGHIWTRNREDMPFDIQEKGGFNEVLKSIRSEVRRPRRQALGIMVDADTDLSARWQAVSDRLRGVGVNVPDSPDPSGTVIDGASNMGIPRIGIWIMPDNASEGEIEDFVVQMIPEMDSVWPLAQGYIDSIPLADRKFTETKTLRAQLHAWLAARENPRQMGLAIRSRDLIVSDVLCEKFFAWLTRLFDF